MSNLWKKWQDVSLVLRIVIFMIIGAIIAFAQRGAGVETIPFLTKFMEVIGSTLFVGALKAVAPLLVFFLVLNAVINAKSGQKSFGTIVVLYIVGTFAAALVAVVASYIFPSVITLTGVDEVEMEAAKSIGEVLVTLAGNLVANPVASIVNGNYLGILLWALVLGVALRIASASTKELFQNLADGIVVAVRWVIQCAPFGVMGLVYTAVLTSGSKIFTEYGHLVAVLVIVMVLIALAVNPIIVALSARVNPYPLVLRALRDSAITAFFTRSSAANIPVNMELAKRLKLNENIYSVSIPLGATINMAGAAVTITVMSMAAVYTVSGSLPDIPTAVLLSGLAAISAAGASGVPGGSLLLIPLACSLFGLDGDLAMQVVGVGFIIGVIQDSFETALNSSSDVVFTAAADYRERRKAGQSINFSQWE
ncbi:MAG: serine/threonine transporter SstT [Eggerthellaceae bacterium]|nr:serine/threonine transporter SstT [Eggerthellaceae bacterium]